MAGETFSYEDAVKSPASKAGETFSYEDAVKSSDPSIETDKGFLGRAVDAARKDPGKAAIAAGGTLAESGIDLAGGAAAAGMAAPYLAPMAMTGVGAIPAAALEMAAFAAGSFGTRLLRKQVEKSTGLDKPLQEAQQANPELTQAAQVATMVPFAAKSIPNLVNMGAKAASKKIVGGAVGGAAFEPIRYGVESGINKLSGSDEEVSPITPSSVAESAGTMALFSGMKHSKAAVDPLKIEPKTSPPEGEYMETAEEPEIPINQDQQAAVNEATSKINETTSTAIQNNLEAGNEQTAQALAETAAATPAKKPVSQVNDTATQEVQTKAPKVTDAARRKAEELGVDITKIPANKFGNVAAKDVVAWHAAQPKTEVNNPLPDETQETQNQPIATDIAANGEPSTSETTTAETVDKTGVLPDLQAGAEPVAEAHDSESTVEEPEEIPEHAFVEGGNPPITLPSLDQVPAGEPLPQQPGVQVVQPKATVKRPKGNVGMTFVSPNEQEGLTLDQAHQNITGDRHAEITSIAQQAAETLPVKLGRGKTEPTTIKNALASWEPDGNENSLYLEHNGTVDPAAQQATAAVIAAHANQKAFLSFTKDPNGSDIVHDFTIPGKSPKEAAQMLSEAGITDRTLVPEGDGTRVLVLTKKPESGNAKQLKTFTDTTDAINNLTDSYGLEHKLYKGTGDYVGADSREEAQPVYASIVRRYLEGIGEASGLSTSDRAGDAHRFHRHRIWELAQDAGLDVGDRPEGQSKEDAEAAQDSGGTVSSLQVPIEKLQEADAKIPEERRDEVNTLLAGAAEYLDRGVVPKYSGEGETIPRTARDIAFDKLKLAIADILEKNPEAPLDQGGINRMAGVAFRNPYKQVRARLQAEMGYGDVEHARSGFQDESGTEQAQGDQADSAVVNRAEQSTGEEKPETVTKAFSILEDPNIPLAQKMAIAKHLADERLLSNEDLIRLGNIAETWGDAKADHIEEALDLARDNSLNKLLGQEDDTLYARGKKTDGAQERGKPVQVTHAEDVLNRIANDSRNDSMLILVAQHLLERFGASGRLRNIPVDVYEKLESGILGEFNMSTKRIGLEASSDAETALEEVLHSLTADRKLPAEIQDLFKRIRSEAVRKGLTSEDQWTRAADPSVLNKEEGDAFHYAFSDPHELLAAALKNRSVRDALNNLEVRDSITGKLVNAWQKLRDTFKKMLGFQVRDNSALDQYLNRMFDHMAERGKPSQETGTLAARKSLTSVYNGDPAERTLTNLNQNIYEPDRVPQISSSPSDGDSFQAAEEVARGSQRPISDAQTEEPKATKARPGNRIFTSPEEAAAKAERLKINQAARPLEEAALREWAEKNGKYIDGDEFTRKWEDGGVEGKDGFKAGAEHAVYFDPATQRWFKTNNLEFHGSYLDYLQRMMLHNQLFPDTAYQLEGFTDFTPYPQPGTETKFQPVVSQPDVKALRGATRPEVVRDMDKLGFRWIKDDDYISDDGSIRVEDLHDENAVVVGHNKDGSPIIAYIDPVIHQTPETKAARIRKVVSEEQAQKLNAIRTTKKSQSIFNEAGNPTEYEPTALDKVEEEAGKYIKQFDNPKDALSDLQERGALISPEAKFPAARMIQAGYEKKIADLMAKKAAGETISSPELTAAQRGRDQAYRLAGEFKSKAGQALVSVKGDNQYAASTYIDTFLKTMLGGSMDELTEGKINVDALKDGMATIKQQVADVTVDSAKRLLNIFGISDPAQIDRIKAEMGDLNSDPKNLKGVLGEMLGADADPQKVSALSQQLNSLYNAAHARMVPSRLSELVKTTYNGLVRKGDQKALAERLATQLKQGRYDEDRLNGTLLDSLGITGYDADTVKKLRDQVNFIQSQPDGSAQRNLAADKLKGALANMEMNQMLKSGYKGKMHAAFELIPDLFRSAVLTSPSTTTMHGAGGLVNTRVQAAFDAYGNFKAALNAGASFQEASGFFKDFMDTCFVGDKGERGSPLIREAWRAIRTGTIGQGLAKGTGKRGADLHGDGVGSEAFQKYAKALAIPGRLMSAWDALNAGTAQEVQQKYAMRAALLNMGQKGPEIATAMKRVFAPTKEELQAAREALDKEVNSGAFDSFTKPEQYFLKGERLEQLHKQIQLAKTDEELAKLLGSEEIQSAVERYTYKGKPMGIWGSASGALNTINKNSKVSTLLMPFTNIMGHLMNTSLDFTPLGYARAKNASLSNLFMPEGSKYAWPKMVEGSPEQIALMTKSIVGTAATAFITSWFLKELHDEEMTGKPPSIMFYGSGPKDPAKRQSWMASGAKPDTLKIGDNYFPYKTLPAISLLGAALGAMHDMYIEDSIPRVHGGKPPTPQQIAEAHKFTWDKAMRLGVALAMTPLTHEYLSGLRNVITVAHDPEGPGASKAVFNQLAGSFSQLTNPSLFRTLRNANPAAADVNNNVANLDLSTTTGKLFQFIPGYIGYNQKALNILGDPIEHKFFSPLTDRWAYAATSKPDPIIATLVNNGLYLPEARRSTPLIVDRKGNQMKVADAGDEAWRSFVVARGEFLKKVLTPNLVNRLSQMDRVQAQAILLGPSIAGASAKYAQAIVERDILKGKIKVNS